jgi:hypothetical protein
VMGGRRFHCHALARQGRTERERWHERREVATGAMRTLRLCGKARRLMLFGR